MTSISRTPPQRIEHSDHEASLVTPALRLRTGGSRPMTAATTTRLFDNDIVCAVSEARGISPTVGISFVNLSTSETVLCQLCDTQTFARTCHKLSVFSPSEIIFAATAKEPKLLSVIRENLNTESNNIKMTAIDRRYWSETTGHEYIQSLAIPADLEPLELSVVNNFYAVCSFGAAMKYIDLSIGLTFVPQNLRIRFEPSEGAMMIDRSTLASLEIVQNLTDPKSRECLFGLLDQTCTRMGARFLKSNLLQPSTDRRKLLDRYEAVSELSLNGEMLSAVRQALSGLVDTDRLLASLVIVDQGIDLARMEQAVNTAIMLKSFVDMIAPIYQALTEAKSKELRKICQLCAPENYTGIHDLLQYSLNENVRFSSKPIDLRNQRIWALNAGANDFLDVARQTYVELTQTIERLVQSLRDHHQMALELKYDPARQYFIMFKPSELEDKPIPEAFINAFHKKKLIECQTMELVKLNQKIRDAHNEVMMISNESIHELIINVRTKLQPLFKISEAISLLDMLSSFAELGVANNYVRPELTSTLAVDSGRHPIIERIRSEHFIPNDVYATQQSRFQIITGCNMSGKSTYIRTIALMDVMAQVGCFVPADYASFPITHQLFARVSTDDSIEANASSFASEMRDMAYILHNVQTRSIILIDELGRGTSTNDGLATAIAISEALIESKAMVWFVTHFRDLPHILAHRAGVVNLHLAVNIEPDLAAMRMKYKIADGIEEQQHYGIALAKVVGLPMEIIDAAMTITTKINRSVDSQRQDVRSERMIQKQNLVLKLKDQLIQAAESDTDEESLRQWLKRLQEEFAIRMSIVDTDLASGPDVAKDSAQGNMTDTDVMEQSQLGLSPESSPDKQTEPRTPLGMVATYREAESWKVCSDALLSPDKVEGGMI